MNTETDKLFVLLKDKALKAGVSEEQLRSVIQESGNDLGAIVKRLGMEIDAPDPDNVSKANTDKKTELFTGNRLFGEPPKHSKMFKFSDEKTPDSGDPVKREAERLRASKRNIMRSKVNTRPPTGGMFPEGSDLLKSSRDKRRELDDIVKSLRENVPQQVDEPFTFPNTDHDFDMLTAVQTSIASFRAAKNKFNNIRGKPSGFTSSRNQVF